MEHWYNKYAVIALSAVAGLFAYNLIPWATADSSSWAAWVQTVGSVLALAIAVWLPHRERKDAKVEAKTDDLSASRKVILSIRDELEVLTENFSGPNIGILFDLAPDEFFAMPIPIPRERFPIYKAVIAQLSLIENDELRKIIVRTYDATEGLVLAAEQNNGLLRSYEIAVADANENDDEYNANRVQHLGSVLVGYAGTMKSVCMLAIGRTRQAIDALNAEVARIDAEMSGL